MRKVLFILISLLFLAACGDDGEDTEALNEDQNESVEETAETEEVEEVEEQEKETNNDVYFDGTTLQMEDIRIEITDTKVIPAGEGRNESDKSIFAIWYEITNLSDEDNYSASTWQVVFDAIQDNDPNVESTLSPGITPEAEHVDSQLDTIKKDGTVEGSFSYELEDEETPVTLIASRGAWEEIDRYEYEIK